jgi:transposase
MFIGYLFGIRSERQLEREIKMNIAYRWFLGLIFHDPVPHHSTISWNCQCRFKDADIFQEIFNEIAPSNESQNGFGACFIYGLNSFKGKYQ